MSDWKMYSEILKRKEMGFSQRQTAKQLGISRDTVSKYWNMKPEEFNELLIQSKSKSRRLDEYEYVLLEWLHDYPDISSAQMLDWLKEHYHLKSISERTVRRHVTLLRKEHNIVKSINTRDYQALQQLPPGLQVQVDFGQKKVVKAAGGSITLYFAAFILAHSRYLYAHFLDRPFKIPDLIHAFRCCFDYYEGIPKEIAIDQDRLMVVSENDGDIIYTYEFEKFIQEEKLHMHVCRKADPESKGIVECGAVKYIKHSFMPNRTFYDLRSYQDLFEEWLNRTANKRLHGTIKKVPAEVFHTTEKQFLRPAPHVEISHTPILTRSVNKDNTIWFNSNRYTVPLGTYNRMKEVEIKIDEENGLLFIYENLDPVLLAEHKISFEKGKLIQNRNHLRDYSLKFDELFDSMIDILGESSRNYLSLIRETKTRYLRDQFGLIKQLVTTHGLELVQEAISYCEKNNLIGATDVKIVVTYLYNTQANKPKETKPEKPIEPKPLKEKIYSVKTEKRDISKYSELAGEGKYEKQYS